ncbi:hypothetical protein ACWJKU_14490 [Methylocaldum sp. MU1018]
MTLKFGRPPPRAAPSGKAVPTDIRGAFTHEYVQWSDADVQALRRGILIRAIEALDNSRLGTPARSELLDWVGRDGIAPFSFAACCLAEGVDADALRDLLAARFHLNRQVA